MLQLGVRQSVELQGALCCVHLHEHEQHEQSTAGRTAGIVQQEQGKAMHTATATACVRKAGRLTHLLLHAAKQNVHCFTASGMCMSWVRCSRAGLRSAAACVMVMVMVQLCQGSARAQILSLHSNIFADTCQQAV